jgi:cell fate (sporulation/competence/biofilm development) regulator YlbF (YheA/YmcA/DUF963 family)
MVMSIMDNSKIIDFMEKENINGKLQHIIMELSKMV